VRINRKAGGEAFLSWELMNAAANEHRSTIHGRFRCDVYPQMYPAEPMDAGGAAMIPVNNRIEEGR